MRYLPVFTYLGLNKGVWQVIDIRNNCEVVETYKSRLDALTMAELLNAETIKLEATTYKAVA